MKPIACASAAIRFSSAACARAARRAASASSVSRRFSWEDGMPFSTMCLKIVKPSHDRSAATKQPSFKNAFVWGDIACAMAKYVRVLRHTRWYCVAVPWLVCWPLTRRRTVCYVCSSQNEFNSVNHVRKAGGARRGSTMQMSVMSGEGGIALRSSYAVHVNVFSAKTGVGCGRKQIASE